MRLTLNKYLKRLLLISVGASAILTYANRSNSLNTSPSSTNNLDSSTVNIPGTPAVLASKTEPQKKPQPKVSGRVLLIAPAYASKYSLRSLGQVPGVPFNYGGLTLQLGSASTLLIGGGSESANGKLYSIKVMRGAGNKIIGFTGTATIFKNDAQYNDAGLFFGPNSVLFFSRYSVNQVGQFKLGSVTPKIIDLSPLGTLSSISGFNIAPFEFSTAGRVKWVSYSSGSWYEGRLVQDGLGTYNLSSVVNKPASQLSGSNGGFSYVPKGSPLFPQPSLLVGEYGAGKVAAYRVNINGDPIPTSRQDFVNDLGGVWGSAIDPLTGDLLLTSWSAGTVTAVSGFKALLLPTISSFTPTSGPAGTVVTVTGSNFTPASAVRFNSKPVRAAIQSQTQLTFKVPNGATTGKISVLGAGISAQSSATDFIVP